MKFPVTITKKSNYSLTYCEFCGDDIPANHSFFLIDTFAGEMTICRDCLDRIAEIINYNQIKTME